MAESTENKLLRWGLVTTVLVNVLLLAFSYGQVTAKIAGLESSVQDVRQEVHELRAVVLEKK